MNIINYNFGFIEHLLLFTQHASSALLKEILSTISIYILWYFPAISRAWFLYSIHNQVHVVSVHVNISITVLREMHTNIYALGKHIELLIDMSLMNLIGCLTEYT
jgi:hypothetical protein